MDFGCINMIDEKLLHNLKQLFNSIINDNKDMFYKIVYDMDILHDEVSEESREYLYEYFRLQYVPWISDEFEFTQEWLDISMKKDPKLMREWNLPADMVYLNKIPFGLFHILTKLQLKGSFFEMFKELLE